MVYLKKKEITKFELEICLWIEKYPKKTLKEHEKYLFSTPNTYSLKKAN